MAKPKLTAVVTADSSGFQAGMAKANKSLGNLEKTSKSMAKNMKLLGAAVLAAVGVIAVKAAKKIIKFGKDLTVLGQKSLSLKKSFESLAKAAGASSKKMLADMKKATRGTIAEVDLLATANRMMLLGLDTSIFDEVMEIARRTAKATGQDINYMVESLSMGLGRQSKMILDNLGIVFQTSEAYEWYAETLGKTSSQLTENEKRLGFQTYAMKIAQENVEKLGEDTLTLTEVGGILSTTWLDVKALIGEKIVGAINNASEAFGGWETIMNRVQQFVEKKLKPAISGVATFVNDFIGYLRGADWSAFEEAIGKLGEAFGFTGEKIFATSEQAQKFVNILTVGVETVALAVLLFTNIINALGASIEYIGTILPLILDLLSVWTLKGDEAKEAIKRVNANLEIMDRDYKITKTSIDNAISAIKNWKSALDAVPDVTIKRVKVVTDYEYRGVRRMGREQEFQFGGIIPKTQAILAHSGEAVLTTEMQKNLIALLRRPQSVVHQHYTMGDINMASQLMRDEGFIKRLARQISIFQGKEVM